MIKINFKSAHRLLSLLLVSIGISSFSFTASPNQFELYRHDLLTRKSLTYSCHVKAWTSNGPDTMYTDEFVAMAKLPDDTLLGGKAFIHDKEVIEYYDGSDVYTHDKDSAYIQKWLISEDGIYNLSGTVQARGVLFDFLDSTRWIFHDKSFTSKSTLSNHIFTISLFSYDSVNWIKWEITYSFKEGDSFPFKQVWHKNMAGMDLNREVTFTDVNYDADISKYIKELMNKQYPIVLSHRWAR
jgi:hypothetical protein